MHYGTSSGLASNEVVSVGQDEKGYIWIGTNNGLQRFDGVRYETFRSRRDDPETIPNNAVIQILFDKQYRLWVVTADQKVGTFDTRNFTYHEARVVITDPSTLSLEKKLICDEQGNILLFFLNAGLLTWNEHTQEFSADNNFIPVPKKWMILDILQQPGTKRYWIGTQTGSAVYDRSTNQLSYSEHNLENIEFIERLGSLPMPRNFLFDKKHRLWFFSWYGGMPKVYVYDLKNDQIVVNGYDFLPAIKNYFEIGGFLEQKNGTIWVRGLGVFGRFLEKEKQFQLVYNGYENEQSISYSRVDNFFEDREENIWVATNTNGLYEFNPSSQFFTNVRQVNRLTKMPGDGSPMSFIETKQKTLLAGTWGDGLYQYDSNYNSIPITYHGLGQGLFAWCFSLSPDSNTIWVAAQPGFYDFDQKKGAAVFHNPAILQNITVRQIAEDKYGNLWIGTQKLGLFKWSAKKGRRNFDEGIEKFESVPTVLIQKITVAKDGYVWIATSNEGAYVIDPIMDTIVWHFGTNEPVERRMRWNNVASVLQYDDSTMIIAANAIYIFNTKQQRIEKTIDFPENIPGINAAMERDRNGYLWISTTNGIFRLNLKNGIFIHFDRSGGIGNDYFVLAASYTTPDGRMLFGADNQFVIFDPQQVHINDPAPDITITGFRLRNESLLMDSLIKNDRVDLAPEDNSITIEFSGLNYNGTYTIDYKLDGLDKDWKKSDRFNQAVYSYLPPGTYTFMAKTENAEGYPSKNITKLVITVRPPFWKTWWFLGLIVFGVVALLFWLDKLRMQKLRATESIRRRIATSLTEDMSNSLSSINLSSELAKTKVDVDKERTKEYIAQISETSNRMVQAMNDMVWSIDPKNDTMGDTIERMKSFAAETEGLTGINIMFDIDEAAANLDLDMAHRYELLSIFKEAISNVSRHSSARHVQVNLRLRNSRFFMMIEDDGKGFDLSEATLGRGMNDMQRRAGDIKASFYIESEKNTGTIIKLEMPV